MEEEEFTLKLDPIKGTATLNGIPISKVSGLAEILSQIITRIEALEAGSPTPTPTPEPSTEPTPEPTPEPTLNPAVPAWINPLFDRVGDIFSQVYLGMDAQEIAYFRNGKTLPAGDFYSMSWPAQEEYIGVRYNSSIGQFEVI